MHFNISETFLQQNSNIVLIISILLPAFNSPLKDTPIAIVTYVFSAYALIVTVAWGSCIYKTVHIKVKKVKTINLTTALAALFSLQTAMITEFSAAGEETWRLNQITGTVVCVLVLLMAAYMLLRSHKNLKGGL